MRLEWMDLQVKQLLQRGLCKEGSWHYRRVCDKPKEKPSDEEAEEKKAEEEPSVEKMEGHDEEAETAAAEQIPDEELAKGELDENYKLCGLASVLMRLVFCEQARFGMNGRTQRTDCQWIM